MKLRPVVDLAARTIHFEPEAEVRERLESQGRLNNRWAVKYHAEAMQDFFHTQDGRIVHLRDVGPLEAGAEKIRSDIEEMGPGQKAGVHAASQSARGCFFTLRLCCAGLSSSAPSRHIPSDRREGLRDC